MSADVHHPLFARLYARLSRMMEPQGMGDLRDELLAGLSGDVIEVGAGNGLNFAHYPASVTRVVAVEPEPYLRGQAEEAAAAAPVPVTVVAGVAARLPAADRSFDAAVASLVLCSVDDQPGALADIQRVLRPGGELRLLEHVQAESARLASVQRVMDATIWPRVAGGCHAGRDTAAAVERAGFTIETLRRLRFPESRLPAPTSPHILATARR